MYRTNFARGTQNYSNIYIYIYIGKTLRRVHKMSLIYIRLPFCMGVRKIIPIYRSTKPISVILYLTACTHAHTIHTCMHEQTYRLYTLYTLDTILRFTTLSFVLSLNNQRAYIKLITPIGYAIHKSTFPAVNIIQKFYTTITHLSANFITSHTTPYGL